MDEPTQTPSAIRRIAWGLIFGIGGAGTAIAGPLLAGILATAVKPWMDSLPGSDGGWGAFVILYFFEACIAVSMGVGIAAGLYAGSAHPRKSPKLVLWSLIATDILLLLYCATLYSSDRWVVRLAVLFAISAVIKYLSIRGLNRILLVGKRETSTRET